MSNEIKKLNEQIVKMQKENSYLRLAMSKATRKKTVIYNDTLKSDMHISLTSEIKSLMIANKDKLDFIKGIEETDELNIIRVSSEFKEKVRREIIKLVS